MSWEQQSAFILLGDTMPVSQTKEISFFTGSSWYDEHLSHRCYLRVAGDHTSSLTPLGYCKLCAIVNLTTFVRSSFDDMWKSLLLYTPTRAD